MNIQVGDPATHRVGSDRYASVVTEVEYFKSGKRAGQVKAVTARWAGRDFGGERFLATEGRDGEIRFAKRSGNRIAWWNTLTIGEAIDYRDPSF